MNNNRKADAEKAAIDSLAVDSAAQMATSTVEPNNSAESAQESEEQLKDEADRRTISRLRGRYRVYQRNPDEPGFITLFYLTINNDNSADFDFGDSQIHKEKGVIDGEVLSFGNDGDGYDATLKFRIKGGELYPFDEKRGDMGATVFINRD